MRGSGVQVKNIEVIARIVNVKGRRVWCVVSYVFFYLTARSLLFCRGICSQFRLPRNIFGSELFFKRVKSQRAFIVNLTASELSI